MSEAVDCGLWFRVLVFWSLRGRSCLWQPLGLSGAGASLWQPPNCISCELSADELGADELTANEMSGKGTTHLRGADEFGIDELSADELTADESSADELTADELSGRCPYGSGLDIDIRQKLLWTFVWTPVPTSL